ncbi:MAG: fibronectin type III domain-containing protein, partial [Candidatus Heimdallarchaeota archaeon]
YAKIKKESVDTNLNLTAAEQGNNGRANMSQSALKRAQMASIDAKTIIFDEGDDLAGSQANDAMYIYVSLAIDPGKVMKIDRRTFSVVDKLILPPNPSPHSPGEQLATLLHAYKGILYVGTDADPPFIVAISLATFKVICVLELFDTYPTNVSIGGVYSMARRRDMLYAGLNSRPGMIVAINLTTFSVNKTLTLNQGENTVSDMVVDGKYLYAGLHTFPGKVVAVDLDRFEEIKSITLRSGEDIARALAIYSDILYVGTHTNPAMLVAIDLATFSEVSSIIMQDGEDAIHSLAVYEHYAYGALWTSPGKIVVVDLDIFEELGTLTFLPGVFFPIDLGVYHHHRGSYLHVVFASSPGGFSTVNLDKLNRFMSAAGAHTRIWRDSVLRKRDLPQKIRLTSLSQFSDSISIAWQTNSANSGDAVVYDASPHVHSSDYEYLKTGSHFTYEETSGYIHVVTLDDLEPDTIYFFRCGGNVGGWSEQRSIKTAPTSSADFTFVVGGDSRGLGSSMIAISKAMAKSNPSLVVHTGDMVNDGSNQSEWDIWFNDVNNNWVGTNGLTIPIIPVLGNHESNSSKYYDQFVLPNNEQWYYFDWGDARIIVLNSEASPSQIHNDQVFWLKKVLSSTPHDMWKIVCFHRNVYYSGSHGNATDLQNHWVPLFDQYKVDIVFQGHSHHYHRTKPLRDNMIVESYDIDGTVFITTGGWGAPLHHVNPQPYTAYGNETYHYMLVNVFRNESLCIEAKDQNDYTFDSLWIYKTYAHELEEEGEETEEASKEIETARALPLLYVNGYVFNWDFIKLIGVQDNRRALSTSHRRIFMFL